MSYCKTIMELSNKTVQYWFKVVKFGMPWKLMVFRCPNIEAR